MKQIVSSGIVTLAIGLIVALFAFNLNKEFVDLRYTLSEKIPTRFIEASPSEAVQQLVVKNNGNIPATKIHIKIDQSIEAHDILKNSVSDVVEEHSSKGHFEAIYPSLPPDTQFSYIFKTSGAGITKSAIEIIHNKGRAKEALAGSTRSIYEKIGNYFILGAILFYIILFLFQGRSMAIDSLESRSSYTSHHEFLNRKRPFYVSQEKWDSIRRKYIESKRKVEYFYSNNIEEQESYKTLNQEKPKYITNEEWVLFKDVFTGCLVDHLTYAIKTADAYSKLDKYFTLKKPKHFPERRWEEIVEEINKNYLTAQKLQKGSYSSLKEIANELESGSPAGMLPAYWDKYKEFLKTRYYEIVYGSVLRKLHPLEYLEEVDFGLLSRDEQDEIEDMAYKIELLRIDDVSSFYAAENFLKNEKPEWVKPDDLERLEAKARSYVNFEKATRKNQSLSNALEYIVNLTPLKEKPECLDENDWQKLLKLEENLSSIAIEIREGKAKLASEKENNENLKAKILKQLKIINDMLNVPESINKIEDYENPFSKGNFENIQKVAKYLIELQKTT